ncbi:gamma-glutamylcyclotransferase family protein [Novosphingobium aquimarinum]|uniref:gamma-glutamylcyclotransferase family protein n=1 Tax=Novosphingobium aquimarinum TaxID=2682494 RepID=UPI0012EBFC93|nr:gamma-glutamylcyclotransferase family protein [Novosphingobium aquimarinum]
MRIDLFVYGTLQPELDTRMSRWLRPFVAEAQPASAPGTLYAIAADDHWYPALVPGIGRVEGTLLRLAFARGDLARLDCFEGREYRRGAVRTVCRGGSRRTAQAYIWNGALPSAARPIRSGNFSSWLKATGSAAFARTRNGT